MTDSSTGASAWDEVAALRAQMADALAEMQAVADQLRSRSADFLAEVDAERAALRAARSRAQAEYAETAREGGAGRAREELQRRIENDETTWREVISGADDHWSAQDVRAELVGDARIQIDQLELSDPDFAEQYRAHADLRRGERTGEWRE